MPKYLKFCLLGSWAISGRTWPRDPFKRARAREMARSAHKNEPRRPSLTWYRLLVDRPPGGSPEDRARGRVPSAGRAASPDKAWAEPNFRLQNEPWGGLNVRLHSEPGEGSMFDFTASLGGRSVTSRRLPRLSGGRDFPPSPGSLLESKRASPGSL